MEIKVGGHTLTKYDNITVSLKHDAPASTFSVRMYYDETNPTHRILFKPLRYPRCEIFHRGTLLLTGTLLSPTAGESETRELWSISGYSLPGILEDSCVIDSQDDIEVDETSQTAAVPDAPLEYSGMTLEEIATKVIKRQGISLVVDDEVRKDPNFAVPFNKVSVKPQQSITNLLDGLCRRKNIVLSHTPKGELLLTRYKTDKILTNQSNFLKEKPVGGEGQAYVESDARVTQDRAVLHDFSKGGYTRATLSVDGQKMHRVIQVVKQVNADSQAGGTLDGAAINPYVPADSRGLRYRRVVQTIGDESDVLPTARMLVGDELKGIQLTIKVFGWTLGGHLITPNQIITFANAKLHLTKKSRWFIQEVTLEGTPEAGTATLVCVPPECFNQEKIVNVFD